MAENKINSKIDLFSDIILNELKLQLDKLENSDENSDENLDKLDKLVKFKSNINLLYTIIFCLTYINNYNVIDVEKMNTFLGSSKIYNTIQNKKKLLQQLQEKIPIQIGGGIFSKLLRFIVLAGLLSPGLSADIVKTIIPEAPEAPFHGPKNADTQYRGELQDIESNYATYAKLDPETAEEWKNISIAISEEDSEERNIKNNVSLNPYYTQNERPTREQIKKGITNKDGFCFFCLTYV